MYVEGLIEIEQGMSEPTPRATNQSINAKNNLDDYFVSGISSMPMANK
jgi:hypothetical protein